MNPLLSAAQEGIQMVEEQKKPPSAMTALRLLVHASETYASVANEHYDATQWGTDGLEMERINKRAERAYDRLAAALKLAHAAIKAGA